MEVCKDCCIEQPGDLAIEEPGVVTQLHAESIEGGCSLGEYACRVNHPGVAVFELREGRIQEPARGGGRDEAGRGLCVERCGGAVEVRAVHVGGVKLGGTVHRW